MTRPRRHIEEQVAMLTRRCIDRIFYMRPDSNINALANYAIARAARQNHQDVHAVMVMSNHVHIVLTDVKARRSDFMRDAMSRISRGRNAFIGRKGYFWDEDPYCDTVLLDHDAQTRKLLYTWLNPVRAGEVDRAEDWPGFKILPRDWGKTIKVPRPDHFVSDRQPEFIEFTPKPPPGHEDMSLEEVIAHYETLLKDAEDLILAEKDRPKRGKAGIQRVLAMHILTRPSTPEPRGQIRPRFASTNPELLAGAIARERAFFSAYARERERWIQGKKRCVFPCGTLWLRRNAPIICQNPDPCEPGLASNM